MKRTTSPTTRQQTADVYQQEQERQQELDLLLPLDATPMVSPKDLPFRELPLSLHV